jgi:hypothetical protein
MPLIQVLFRIEIGDEDKDGGCLRNRATRAGGPEGA